MREEFWRVDERPAVNRPFILPSIGRAEARPGLMELAGAYWRQENPIGALLALEPLTGAWDPDFDAGPYIPVEFRRPEFSMAYARANTPEDVDAITRQIRREMRDRETMGQFGFLTNLGVGIGVAGLLDPTNLLPIAPAVDALKGARFMRRAVTTAKYGLPGLLAAEGLLYAAQETRTPSEVAFNLGAGTLMMGLLGGAVTGLKPREARAIEQAVKQDIDFYAGEKAGEAWPAYKPGTHYPVALPASVTGGTAVEVLDRALSLGYIDPGAHRLLRYFVTEVDPDFDGRALLEIWDAVKVASREIKRLEGIPDEATAYVVGKTASQFTDQGLLRTAISLFRGHDGDTAVEEWYHYIYDQILTPAQRDTWAAYHRASGDTRAVHEHYAQFSRDFFFSNKIHEKAGPLRTLFRNAKQALLLLIQRIRGIRGARIPKEIEDLVRRGGMRREDYSEWQRESQRWWINLSEQERKQEARAAAAVARRDELQALPKKEVIRLAREQGIPIGNKGKKDLVGLLLTREGHEIPAPARVAPEAAAPERAVVSEAAAVEPEARAAGETPEGIEPQPVVETDPWAGQTWGYTRMIAEAADEQGWTEAIRAARAEGLGVAEIVQRLEINEDYVAAVLAREGDAGEDVSAAWWGWHDWLREQAEGSAESVGYQVRRAVRDLPDEALAEEHAALDARLDAIGAEDEAIEQAAIVNDWYKPTKEQRQRRRELQREIDRLAERQFDLEEEALARAPRTVERENAAGRAVRYETVLGEQIWVELRTGERIGARDLDMAEYELRQAAGEDVSAWWRRWDEESGVPYDEKKWRGIQEIQEARRKARLEGERTGYQIRAVHGTVHTFERFSGDFAETGDGSQVIARGLYFTTDREVGEYYSYVVPMLKNRVEPIFTMTLRGTPLADDAVEILGDLLDPDFVYSLYQGEPIPRAADSLREIPFFQYTKEERLDRIRRPLAELKNQIEVREYEARESGVPRERLEQDRQYREWIVKVELLEGLAAAVENGELEMRIKPQYGRWLYEVNLFPQRNPGDYDLLDWSGEVTDAQRVKIRKITEDWYDYDYLEELIEDPGLTGERLYRAIEEDIGGDEASRILKEYGIDGVEFPVGLDGIGFNPVEKNIVIFSDRDVEVTGRVGYQVKTASAVNREVQGRLDPDLDDGSRVAPIRGLSPEKSERILRFIEQVHPGARVFFTRFSPLPGRIAEGLVMSWERLHKNLRGQGTEEAAEIIKRRELSRYLSRAERSIYTHFVNTLNQAQGRLRVEDAGFVDVVRAKWNWRSLREFKRAVGLAMMDLEWGRDISKYAAGVQAAAREMSAIMLELGKRANKIGQITGANIEQGLAEGVTHFPRIWRHEYIRRYRPAARRILRDLLGPDVTEQDIDGALNSISGSPTGSMGYYDLSDAQDAAKIDTWKSKFFERRELQVDHRRLIGVQVKDARGNPLTIDLIETDALKAVERYLDSVMGSIVLGEKYGDVTMRKEFQMLWQHYDELLNAQGPDVDTSPILRERDAAFKDLLALRDMINGTYARTHGWDPAGKAMRASKLLMNINAMLYLGGVVFSSLADIARPLFHWGLEYHLPALAEYVQVFRTPEFAQMRREMRDVWGAALSAFNHERLFAISDIAEDARGDTAVERGVRALADQMGLFTLMDLWNSSNKEIAGYVAVHATLDVAGKVRAAAERGVALTMDAMAGEVDRRFLVQIAQMGLGLEDLVGVARQVERFGEKYGPLTLTRTDRWDNLALRSKFESAMVKEIDQTILTPSVGDKPLWAHWGVLAHAYQFKSFGMAGMRGVVIQGLQDMDLRTLEGILASTAAGAGVYYLKALEAGRDPSDNPGEILLNAIDKGGLTAYLMDLDSMIHRVSQGTFGVQSWLTGEGAQRFAAKSTSDIVFGPTVGTLENMSRLGFRTIPHALTGNLVQGDETPILRLWPYSKAPYVRFLMERLREGARESLPTAAEREAAG